jgi:branched-subunit amino acid aminotransferase/4-amino-4-deoxychorismate lyase
MDGRLAPADALDDAPAGSGCYTTARVEAATPRFAERHVRRLRRDAAQLGLEPPPPESCLKALVTLSVAAFPSGAGIVRLELRADGRGGTRLIGTARPLGHDPAVLGAVVSPLCHPGPGAAPGAKLSARGLLDDAADRARRSGADEAILVDREGWVVEGARTNLAGIGPSGAAWTPPVARGGVAGLAREIVLESCSELRETDVSRESLAAAQEIVALNAVRGAVPVIRLEGRPVGSGQPGPLSERLRSILAAAG